MAYSFGNCDICVSYVFFCITSAVALCGLPSGSEVRGAGRRVYVLKKNGEQCALVMPTHSFRFDVLQRKWIYCIIQIWARFIKLKPKLLPVTERVVDLSCQFILW